MNTRRDPWGDARGVRFGLLSKIAQPGFYGLRRRVDGSVHVGDLFDSYRSSSIDRLQATFDLRDALSRLQQDLFVDKRGLYVKATELGRTVLDAYVDELRRV